MRYEGGGLYRKKPVKATIWGLVANEFVEWPRGLLCVAASYIKKVDCGGPGGVLRRKGGRLKSCFDVVLGVNLVSPCIVGSIRESAPVCPKKSTGCCG